MAEDDSVEEGLEDQVTAYSKKAFAHLLTVLVLLPVLFILFAVGLISIVNTNKEVTELLAVEPENRASGFNKEIEKTREKVKQQYAEHLEKMEDDSLLQLNEKFRVMYDVSQENERDYGILLETYQQAVYKFASKVRGSGEWYYYYDRKLKRHLDVQKSREQAMEEYFRSED